MRSVCTTQLKRNIRIGALAVLLAAAVLAAAYALYTREPELLDPNALPGEPVALEDAYGYSQLAPQGVPCVVRLCGSPKIDGKDVYLNLTSPEGNVYLVRAEVYSVAVETDPSTGEKKPVPDKLLGKTGFIRPGTYVEKLRLDKGLSGGENSVYIKLALRDEESGRSGGSFYVGTTFVKN